MEINNFYVELIRRYLKENKTRQYHFSEELGICHSSLSRYLSYKLKISGTDISKLDKFFKEKKWIT